MNARNYRPDVGRFLSQDRYESAAGDQVLQADPLTQNRYAFAGGNPVNNVEFDGHHGGDTHGRDTHQRGCFSCSAPRKRGGGGGRAPTKSSGGGAAPPAPAPAPAPAYPPSTLQAITHGVAPAAALPPKLQPIVNLIFGPSPLDQRVSPRSNEPEKKDGPNALQSIGNAVDDAAGDGMDWWMAQQAKKDPLHPDRDPVREVVGAAEVIAGVATGGTSFGLKTALQQAGRRALPKLRSIRWFGRGGGGPARRPRCGSSFAPGTPVLMAGGSSTPIERIRVGDVVRATNPATGKDRARRVTRLITSGGPKELVRLGIAGTTTVATANHPYYLLEERRWVAAAELKAGDRLRRPAGRVGLVERAERFTVVAQRVHNLTVGGDHTYYAGASPVLVHNCPGSGGRGSNDLEPDPRALGSHTTWARDQSGRVDRYTSFDWNGLTGSWGAVFRFKGSGGSHGGVNPPLVYHRRFGKQAGARPVVPREPLPHEYPPGY